MNTLLLLASVAAGLSGHWTVATNTNFVNDLAGQGETLYLATNGGLQRFTVSDTTFLTALTNADGLPSNTLRCCAMDDAGNVWLGTDGGGLVVFDPVRTQFTVYSPDRLTAQKINCLYIAGESLLVGTDNGAWIVVTGSTRLDFTDDQIIYLNGLPRAPVLAAGKGTDFWFGTNQGASRVTSDLTVHNYSLRGIVGDSAKAFLYRNDTLFAAAEFGVASYDPVADAFISYAPFDARRLVYRMVDWQGFLTLALDAGVMLWTGSSYDALWWADCRSLLSREYLWAAFGGPTVLLGDGLGRIDRDRGQARFRSPGMASNMVGGAARDTSGQTYVAHYLTSGEPRKVSRRRLDGKWDVMNDTVSNGWAVARDRRNRIWFGHWGVFPSNGGLSVFDPALETWDVYNWGPFDFRNVVAAFGIDGRDNKWVFSQTGEAVAVDDSGRQMFFRVPGAPPAPAHGYDFAFEESPRVWFGTMAGLAMIDYRGTLFDPTDDSLALFSEGLQSTNVTSVAVDNEGRPWVATSQGAAVLENGRFRYISTSGATGVSRVRVDSWGYVWFLTDRGLQRYDPRSERWDQPDSLGGQIPNLSGRSGFYFVLELDEAKRHVLVGTQLGLNEFTFRVPEESTARSIRVYPNPFITGEHSAITFDQLPADAQVRVFTLSGEYVADLEVNPTYCRAAWDVRNWNGRLAAAGIYLAVVSSPQGKGIARFAVVR